MEFVTNLHNNRIDLPNRLANFGAQMADGFSIGQGMANCLFDLGESCQASLNVYVTIQVRDFL